MPTTECGFESRPDVLVQYGPTLYIEIGFDPPKKKRREFFALGVFVFSVYLQPDARSNFGQ